MEVRAAAAALEEQKSCALNRRIVLLSTLPGVLLLAGFAAWYFAVFEEERVAIFGYGSLLNRESAVGTNPSASEFYGACLVGYSRKWCYRCDHSNNFGRRATNSKGEEKGHYVAVAALMEHGAVTSGVVYTISRSEFDKLKTREKEYDFPELDWKNVTEFIDDEDVNKKYDYPDHWEKYPIYTCALTENSPNYIAGFSEEYPFSSGYWKIITDACAKEYNEDFQRVMLKWGKQNNPKTGEVPTTKDIFDKDASQLMKREQTEIAALTLSYDPPSGSGLQK